MYDPRVKIEAAILFIGEIKRTPTVIDVNGKEEISTRFLKSIGNYLEFPEGLFFVGDNKEAYYL